MTRPQFAEVAGHFRVTGRVEPAMLLAAASRFAGSVLEAGIDVVGLCVGPVRALAAGQAVSGFVADLTGLLAPVQFA